jgi:hypothetical protein
MTKPEGETMKNLPLRWALPGLVVICALGFTTSSAFSKQEGNLKSKRSHKIEAKKTEGREAGEMPARLELQRK